MEELIIDDKKYISSKRAAKLTGYAKDYVGQLCREGRVPARLVGRGWYVLESAIQDHRFGKDEPEEKVAIERPEPSAKTKERPLSSAMDAPRYEAEPVEAFPSINLLRNDAGNRAAIVPDSEETIEEKESEMQEIEPEQQVPQQDIHEAWQSWFTQDASGSETPEPLSEKEAEVKEKETIQDQKDEQAVRVHVARRGARALPPQALRPRTQALRAEGSNFAVRHPEAPTMTPIKKKRGGGGIPRTIKAIGFTVAAVAILLAAINSGYFDKYIISSKRGTSISGITLYQNNR